ncbi:hypothetical protein VST7929_03032 [Vibrio stylophorae]|uniref:Zona occludens toxin N-terminal domain-containing protein n=1 Tax=Vibrio stylophorae TaxID=659351 RepID=A0ABN8DXL7_9VIBR|nr:zonular occludens toxin domain-containing protein [Vibrio stylophorae]CAH0535458.1 hypothetical protein VST7929_03032 [Vibrio stylophorae]
MLFGYSGLPGSGKTLNCVVDICSNGDYAGRQVFYHGIPVLLLDYEMCRSFTGWFYGVYFLKNRGNSALLRVLKKVHDQDRFAELDDFPYLQSEYEKFEPMELWLYWVRRCYTREHLKKLDECIAVLGVDEAALTFEQCKHLNLHWNRFDDANKWFELPHESLIMIDEVQNIWPTRAAGAKIPQAVEEVAEHRHKGWDLYYVSQNFGDCDVFLRRRMGRFVHFEPVTGSNVKRFSANKFIAAENDAALKAVGSDSKQLNKHFFGVYLSSIKHTHKFKLTAKTRKMLMLGAFGLSLIAYSGSKLYARFTEGGQDTAQQVEQPSVQTSAVSQDSKPDDRLQYIERYQARFAVLPWSAPIYDELTKEPLNYPDLVCIDSQTKCACYTQQGTYTHLELENCRTIARGGLFDPFAQKLDSDFERVGGQVISTGGK